MFQCLAQNIYFGEDGWAPCKFSLCEVSERRGRSRLSGTTFFKAFWPCVVIRLNKICDCGQYSRTKANYDARQLNVTPSEFVYLGYSAQLCGFDFFFNLRPVAHQLFWSPDINLSNSWSHPFHFLCYYFARWSSLWPHIVYERAPK